MRINILLISCRHIRRRLRIFIKRSRYVGGIANGNNIVTWYFIYLFRTLTILYPDKNKINYSMFEYTSSVYTSTKSH